MSAMQRITSNLIYVYIGLTAIAFVWIFGNFVHTQVYQPNTGAQIDGISDLRRQLDAYKNEIRRDKARSFRNDTNASSLPTLYLITPTYLRAEQKAELTRLSNTLRHVPNIHWIIIEDSSFKTVLVEKFLAGCEIPYTHLNASSPKAFKLNDAARHRLKHRGVLQRNAGLDWIREQQHITGVVYFADDDNTYDILVFEEMRFTNKVSVWPVGLVGHLRYESPILTNGKVTGWHTYFKPERMFVMDMAGFAVNIKLIKDNPSVMFHLKAAPGTLESDLVSQLPVTLDDLEPKASECTKVLVWHTRTQKSPLDNEDKMLKGRGLNSNKTLEV